MSNSRKIASLPNTLTLLEMQVEGKKLLQQQQAIQLFTVVVGGLSA